MKTLALVLTLIATQAHAEPATVDQLVQLLAKNPTANLNANTGAKGQPVSFEVTVNKTTYTADADPAAFFAAVRAAAPVTTVKLENATLVNDYGRLTLKSNDPSAPVIFDLADDVVQNEFDPADMGPGETQGGNVGTAYKLLSVVGTMVSYSVIGDSYTPGAAHPNYADTVISVDVGSIAKMGDSLSYLQSNLADQVDEASLLAALKADRFLLSKIDSAASRKKLLAARNLQELGDIASDALMGSCYSLPVYDGKLGSFAIYDYDAARNLVSVRVPMEASAHACAGAAPTKLLALTVKPRIDLELSLREMTKNKTGLLMKNAR